MVLPNSVLDLADVWSSLFADHTSISTSVIFLHLAGVLGAGGLALVADRLIWRSPSTADRVTALEHLPSTHRLVLQSLAIVVVSGVLLTLADLQVYLTSTVFYLKLAAVTLLALNGLALRRAERLAQSSDPARGWRRLRVTAAFSAVLWLVALYLGVLLTKAA